MKVKCQVCGIIDEDFKLMLIKLYNPERLQCVNCSAKQDGLKIVTFPNGSEIHFKENSEDKLEGKIK